MNPIIESILPHLQGHNLYFLQERKFLQGQNSYHELVAIGRLDDLIWMIVDNTPIVTKKGMIYHEIYFGSYIYYSQDQTSLQIAQAIKTMFLNGCDKIKFVCHEYCIKPCLMGTRTKIDVLPTEAIRYYDQPFPKVRFDSSRK